MAQNALPKNVGALLVLAGQCAAGLTTYGAILQSAMGDQVRAMAVNPVGESVPVE